MFILREIFAFDLKAYVLLKENGPFEVFGGSDCGLDFFLSRGMVVFVGIVKSLKTDFKWGALFGFEDSTLLGDDIENIQALVVA